MVETCSRDLTTAVAVAEYNV